VKRRLVLHLGLWKTGTTTLQYFLRENPLILAEMGVHYPKVGPDNRDHHFFRARSDNAFLADEVSHQFPARKLAGWNRRAQTDTSLWSTAFRLIEESGARTGIISYEDFSARVARYHFDAIAGSLRTFDVAGIIYLRPQENLTASLYSHSIWGIQTSLSFSEFINNIEQRLIYSVLLDRMSRQIPMNSLVARNFDEAAKRGLIQDFFASLDVPDALTASGGEPPVRNRSHPHWAVLFLLKCIQASLPAERLMDIRLALFRSEGGPLSLPLRPGLHVASPDERKTPPGYYERGRGTSGRRLRNRIWGTGSGAWTSSSVR
jgi:hypothetical protein